MNKIKINEVKNKIRKIPFVIPLYKKLVKKKEYEYKDEKILLETANKTFLEWPSEEQKPHVGLVREHGEKIFEGVYWTKYERFLKNNKIKYEYLNMSNSTFINEVSKYDIIIWRTPSDPSSQQEAEGKIRLIEKYMGKTCLPSFDEIWFYEDKIRQDYLFKLNNLPAIKTFITYSKQEAIEYIKNCNYPFVSKISTGSGSQGVQLIKNYNTAKKMCDDIFGRGLNSYWTYLKQKDYVYFQEYVEGASFDLRIIIIGNSYFGYYRDVPMNDFRASGAGIFQKRGIPKEALLMAKKVKDCMPPTRVLAVDLLQNPQDNKYYIIETSLFVSVDTPEQLVVDGVPGRYIYDKGEFIFEEGKFWIQELTLLELFEEWNKKRVR